MGKTGELSTVRAVLHVGPLADQIDILLAEIAKIDNEPMRDKFVEYILLRGAYQANMFYVKKLEVQSLFAPRAQQLFDMIASRIQDELHRQARIQLGTQFFYGYEYELENAEFRFGSLRLTLHRTEKLA